MLDILNRAYQRAKKAFRDIFSTGAPAPNWKEVTRNEQRLDADEFTVKRKLGRSFFTRRITANSRHARLASLSTAELDLARKRGWVR